MDNPNELTWKFSMNYKTGPVWDVYEDLRLVAFAKRAASAGWFVRISELNPTPDTDKLYIGEDVFPIHFMYLMLSLHKKETL